MNEGNFFWRTDILNRLLPLKLVFITIMSFISIIVICSASIANEESDQNNCLRCHQGLQNDLARCAQQWADSVHATFSIYCEECHGGDPNFPYKPEVGKNGFIGVPGKRTVLSLCDRCHANARYMKKYNIRVDEENQYKNSIHGQRLLKEENMNVAGCVDCHGSHDIRIADDPKSRVNHFNVAETCAQCHANNNLMQSYGIPTDQLIQYKKSYHGRILYQKIKGKNSRLVPSCPGCHGIHGSNPSGVAKVANACYNCHLMTKRYFQESVHSLIPKENQRPRCIDCHGYHNISSAEEESLAARRSFHCNGCHSLNSKEYQAGQRIRDLLLKAKVAVEKSQNKINQVKKDLDIDISEFNLDMRDVDDYFDEAMSAIHSQDIHIVKPIVQKIHKYTNTINQKVDGRYREIRQRKRWLVQVLLSISLLFSFVVYQRSKLKK